MRGNRHGKTWTAAGSKGGSAGIRLGIRYVHNADHNSNDLTRVTVRLGQSGDAVGFSFVPEDVLAAGAMHLPDFGALVAPSEKELSLGQHAETSGQTLGTAGARPGGRTCRGDTGIGDGRHPAARADVRRSRWASPQPGKSSS